MIHLKQKSMYIAIAIITLAVIAAIFVVVRIRKGKRPEKLSRFAAISLAFVGAGIAIASGDNGVIGYSLILVGMAFAIADIVRKRRAKESI